MFSKSKRFVETASCAPPVGSYNVPDKKSVKLAGFEKAARWTETSEESGKSLDSFENTSTGTSFSVSNKSFNPIFMSSVKKNKQPPSQKKVKKDDKFNVDIVRKSLEVDVEFQQAKVNSLLEKIRSLEIQLKGTQDHSQEIEKSNKKLHELLADIRNEKSSLMAQNKSLEEKIQNLINENTTCKESLENQLIEYSRKLEQNSSEFAKEKENLLDKLKHSEDMNVDFREQLESVEAMMTNNLRGLSEKYECLEETFDNVQTDYKQKLQRSNSLVEKIKEANENAKYDLELMQQVYTNLKLDHEQCQNEMVDKDNKYKANEELLTEKINCLQEKINELQSSLEISETTLDDEKKKSEVLVEESKELTSLVKKTEEEKERKNKECLRLSEEVSVLRFKANNLEEIKLKFQENLQRIEEELEAISQEKEKEKLKFENEHDLFEKSKTEMMNKIDILEADLERSQEELIRITGENQEENEKIRIERQNFMRTKNELMETNTVLKSNIEQASEQFKTRESEFMLIKQKMQGQIEQINQELEASNEKLELLEENKSSIIDDSQLIELQGELESWQKKYKDLETKVGPFMSQLEQFEFEKQTLLNENAYTQQEMSKLSEKYASILGHQNNKQKIHHIKKLKEENITLKNDVFKLRGEVSKLKRNQLENCSKKYDSSKAFKLDDKENSAQPLKQRNS